MTLVHLFLCATVGLAPPAGAEESPEQVVLVERAHWPVLVQPLPGRPEAEELCKSLEPGDVELERDGQPLTVTALGPRPLPRLHALLVDTSASMVERLEKAQEAAVDYIEALPDGDRALIASFDESMVLGTPPTADRDAARAAVERLETGYYTALWDALYYLIRYVETLPGEKVILLLTDGEDSASMREHRYEDVVTLAAGTPNLMIFPVGIRLPRPVAAASGALGMARGRLGRLAAQTGGEFFEIEYISHLSRMLRRIRERLDERLYVSYIPDVERGSGRRPGRLRLRLRAGLPCRLDPLGAPGRYERRVLGRSADLVRTPTEAGHLPVIAEGCLPDGEGGQVIAALRLDDPRSAGSHPVLYAVERGRALLGRATDIALESGPLFRLKPYVTAGRLRVGDPRQTVFEERDIAVITPPLEQLLERLNGAAELLLFMLERDLCAPDPAAEGWERAPFLVHGHTFFELRELLGRALFSERGDYREWAVLRSAETARAALRALDDLPEGKRPAADRRRILVQALLAQAADPDVGRPHVTLAEWLGDVSARRTVLELEREIANALLGQPAGARFSRERADRAIESWPRLARWFPPAVRGRILTPLIPVHDPRRDVIGFYRFVLPRPATDGPKPELLPGRPRGLRLVRSLVDSPAATPWLAASPRIVALDDVTAQSGELRGRVCGDEIRPPRKLVLQLTAGPPDEEEEVTAELTVYYDPKKVEPACYRVTVPTRGSERLRRMSGLLDGLLSGIVPREKRRR